MRATEAAGVIAALCFLIIALIAGVAYAYWINVL